jgi:hypothetical protein
MLAQGEKRKEKVEAEEDVQGYMTVSEVGRVAMGSSSSDWPLLEAHRVINKLTKLEITKRNTHALVTQAARRTVNLRISSCSNSSIHGGSGRITTSSREGRGNGEGERNKVEFVNSGFVGFERSEIGDGIGAGEKGWAGSLDECTWTTKRELDVAIVEFSTVTTLGGVGGGEDEGTHWS